MGCDAVLGIASWHRWQELLDYAHVVVMAPPGWQLPVDGPVAEWLLGPPAGGRDRAAPAPAGYPRGGIAPLAISSTEIRDACWPPGGRHALPVARRWYWIIFKCDPQSLPLFEEVFT